MVSFIPLGAMFFEYHLTYCGRVLFGAALVWLLFCYLKHLFYLTLLLSLVLFRLRQGRTLGVRVPSFFLVLVGVLSCFLLLAPQTPAVAVELQNVQDSLLDNIPLGQAS